MSSQSLVWERTPHFQPRGLQDIATNPMKSHQQRSHSNISWLSCGRQAELPKDMDSWVEKRTVTCTVCTSRHPEVSLNNRGRNWIPWFLHDVLGCWHRQEWPRLAGLQKTCTHILKWNLTKSPYLISARGLYMYAFEADGAAGMSWTWRQALVWKGKSTVEEATYLSNQGRAVGFKRTAQMGFFLKKTLFQWTALFIPLHVLTTKADKKANNILGRLSSVDLASAMQKIINRQDAFWDDLPKTTHLQISKLL